MPVEIIGEVGTPGADPEWISAQATLAIRHIAKVCGPPPSEMELEVQWQEHQAVPCQDRPTEDARRFRKPALHQQTDSVGPRSLRARTKSAAFG
jgi:hypothetical protein